MAWSAVVSLEVINEYSLMTLSFSFVSSPFQCCLCALLEALKKWLIGAGGRDEALCVGG